MCEAYQKRREGVPTLARRVMAAVEDLLFRSKIGETAAQLGIEASFPRSPKKLEEALSASPPDLLILDLNSSRFEPLQILQTMKSEGTTRDVKTVGFLSHVQKDLAVAAKEAGCDRVMARSAFTRDLPKVLAEGEASGTVDEAGVG
jgi:PleD family two-component response regulator